MFNIAGYEVKEKIFENDKALFFKGVKIDNGIAVILKTFRSKYPPLTDIDRLKQDYEIIQTVHSSYVMKTYSLETCHQVPVLVMEDFGGEPLAKLLFSQRKFTLPQFLSMAINISKVLAALYQAKIIHGAINPSNLFFNQEEDLVKIANFGYASFFARDDSKESYKLHQEEEFLAYISPEQTDRIDCAVDYRSDFYSLGILFYRLITGVLPFQTIDKLELLHNHLAVKPIPPAELDQNIPQAVSDLIMKLLEKVPQKRYQSVRGFTRDLMTCFNQLQDKGFVEPFKVGQNDLSDQFQISEKLYGREQDFDTLIHAFNSAKQGHKEVVMISGPSGVGKSVLVHEADFVFKKQGRFIEGKFDQYGQDSPYSGLVAAFTDLIQQILATSEKEIEYWRIRLLESLGSNGKLIVDMIPAVEKLIGKQPEVEPLSAEESKNRFQHVFQNFVQALCSEQYPLVLFLDDLQWADSSMLNLIEMVMSDSGIHYILLIGAYREDANLYLQQTITVLGNDHVHVQMICLNSFRLEHIQQLLSETLHCELQDVGALAELGLQKTEGNPFFLKQFLVSLYQDQFIYFDEATGMWQWNMIGIENSDVSENALQLLANRIQKLALPTQQILQLAACLGIRFNLRELSIISKRAVSQISRQLSEAVNAGLIALDKAEDYVFLHDRIQQAAYSLIPKDYRIDLHLKIGRALLATSAGFSEEEKLFDIVNQLNMGASKITEKRELIELAQLELICGRRAKEAVAYDAAYRYFSFGIRLIQEFSWKEHYKLQYSLNLEAAESAYLKGAYSIVEKHTKAILVHDGDLLDKIRVYEIIIAVYSAQNRLLDAAKTGLFALKLLNVKFPNKPRSIHVLVTLMKVRLSLKGKSPSDLLNLPAVTDPRLSAIARIIIQTANSTYKIAPKLTVLMLLKGFEIGNTTKEPFGYVAYGIVLCTSGKIRQGFSWGQAALELVNSSERQYAKTQIITFVHIFISHWKLPLRDTLKPFLEAYTHGFKTGDFNYACLALFGYCYHSYYAGKELFNLEKEMRLYNEVIGKAKYRKWLDPNLLFHQVVLNLMGCSEDPCRIQGEMYDETKVLPVYIEEADRNSIFDIYFNRLCLCYLFGRTECAVESAKLAELYLDGVTGTATVPVFYFYSSLTLLSVCGEVAFLKRKKILWKVLKNKLRIKRFAADSPANYLHKYYLLEAEQARILGKKLKAMEYYNQAIQLAGKNGFLQEEALANELAAKFYHSIGNDRVAKSYIKDAYYGYQLWGAKAKARQLEQLYGELLTIRPDSNDDSMSELVPSCLDLHQTIDLITVVKAAHVIACEMDLQLLLQKIMKMVLQNAGAQQGYFVLEKEGQLYIEAEGRQDQPTIKVMNSVLLQEAATTAEVPASVVSVIQQAARTQTRILLADEVKSALCIPLVKQGKLIGVLYLENNLIPGAFNSERVQVLDILAVQMAISLENAILYDQLKKAMAKLELYSQTLEKTVAERTKQLQLVQASRKDLLANISHDLRAPVSSVMGYVELLLDDLNESPEQQRFYLERIQARMMGLNRLIQDFFQLVNMEVYKMSFQMTEISIGSLIETIYPKYLVDVTQAGFDLVQDLQIDPDVTVEVDLDRMDQSFANLITNSMRYMTQGGRITIGCEQLDSDQPMVLIKVADNGLGIDAKDIPNVFERFYQASNYQGISNNSGLGLAIVKEIVKAHGGDIWVDSTVSQGCTICFTLPISSREASSKC